MQLTRAEIEARFRRTMLELAGDISKSAMLTGEEIEDVIRSASESVGKEIDRQFSLMQTMVSERRKNQSAFAGANFISIGYDCFPRTLLTRWGIKRPRRMGEVSGPFDLAVHPHASTLKLLRTDFAGYFDNLSYDPVNRHPHDLAEGIRFNHEVGDDETGIGFPTLQTRYRARVENFRRLMADPTPAVFVLHSENVGEAYGAAILSELREQRNGRDTEAIWLQTPAHGTATRSATRTATAYEIVEPYPFPRYRWPNYRHTFSIRGQTFEKRCIDRISSFVAQEGLADAA